MSWPSKRIVPAVGLCSRVTSRARVDLPQPDSPTSPTVSPRCTVRSTPSTARRTRCGAKKPSRGRAKCFFRPLRTSSGSACRRLLAAPRMRPRRHLQRAALLRHPAARRAIRADRQQFGMFGALLHRKRAAGAEAAAGRPGAWIGRLALDGGQPPAVRLAVEPRRGIQQRPGIGVLRVAQQVLGRAFLHHLAGIHHQHAGADIGDDAEIVADQDHRGAEIGVQPAQQVEDLRLDRHVQRGGRLIGDQQRRLVGEAHRQHHALPHAAGVLVRVAAHRALRRGDAHPAEQRDRARPCGLRREAAMRGHRLDQLPGDAQHRVQRGHRVLEDHGDVAAAHLADRVLVQVRQVAAAEGDRAADDAGRLVEQAHDRLGADALARAGFADDAERLARVKVEADAVDGAHRAGIGQEPGAQVAHLQQRLSGFVHADRASRGGRRRRS